jgi:hypothetical protein
MCRRDSSPGGWLVRQSGLTDRFEHRDVEPSVPAPKAFLAEKQVVP